MAPWGVFLGLCLLLLSGAGLASPPTPTPVTSPHLSPPTAVASPSSPASVPSDLAFDLPPLVIPRWGENWWEEPCLFEMADGGKLTGQQRALRVLERVHHVVDSAVASGDGLSPEVVVDQGHGVTVVRADQDVLVTVLPEDLPEYCSQLSPELRRHVEYQVAQRWAVELNKQIQGRVAVRTPQLRWLGLALAAGALILVIGINVVLRWFARRFLGPPLWSLRALVWLTWLSFLLAVVPELDGLQRVVQGGLLEPLWLILTAGLGSAVLFQVVRASVRRYLRSLSRHRPPTPRQQQRLASLEGAAFFALRLALFVGACFYVMTGMGIELSHLVAGAGLFGAALTLVSQDLIRDLIAGFNILLEDQFVVGDWIEAGAISGTVEAFHLRGTRVRAMDGTACVVPNSELRTVKNHSLEWSQVDYQVVISLAADAERGLMILAEEAERLVGERADEALGTPEVLGLDSLGPGGLTLRLLVRTRPLQQWGFKRALNRRVLARFRAEGIDLAGRRQNLRIEGAPPETRDRAEPMG